MSRERLTRKARSHQGVEILAEIEELERHLNAADDAQIEGWADDIADEERDIVKDSTGEEVKDEGDQNAKAEKNWPVSASEKQRIAGRLVSLVKALISE